MNPNGAFIHLQNIAADLIWSRSRAFYLEGSVETPHP